MTKIGTFEVLNSKAVKKILTMLQKQFCFNKKLDYVFLVNKKDKVYIINRDVELLEYEKLRVDSLGMYFGKYYKDGFRLSIEGTQLIGKECKCNVIEISKQLKHDWFKGIDLDLELSNCYILLKSKNDFLGCAKVKNGFALNSVPTARTLKVINEESENNN